MAMRKWTNVKNDPGGNLLQRKPDRWVRLPPLSLGAKVLFAKDIKDQLDWGQVAHGLEKHWLKSEGEGVVVGVADTGVDAAHPDLKDAIIEARDFTRDRNPSDQNGHGCHVIGTLAARRGVGPAIGVAPKCKVFSAKVLDSRGSGANNWVAAGVRWLADCGCHLISMSLGSQGYDALIHDAIKYAISKGCIVVCAAGNDGEVNGPVGLPANLDGTLAIASYDRNGKLSRFSSRGPEVDFAFPGQDILSTWPGGAYRSISGTSMATPFCTGSLALILGAELKARNAGKKIKTPCVDYETAVEHLQRGVKDLGPAGKDTGWGWGIPDLGKAIDVEAEEAAKPREINIGGVVVRMPATGGEKMSVSFPARAGDFAGLDF